MKKKLILLLVIAAMTVSVSSCRAKQTSSTASLSTVSTQAPTMPPVTPTPIPPTPVPIIATVSPVVTAPPVSQPVNQIITSYVNGMTIVSSTQYPEFACGYPAEFTTFNDGSNAFVCARGTFSNGGVAEIKINACPSNGISVASAKAQYVSQFDGSDGNSVSIDYENSGKDFFAVRMYARRSYYYKYCKFINGKMYYFEINFDKDSFSEGDALCNSMYNTFHVNR